MNPYNNNKPLMHTSRLMQLKRGEQPNPIHIHFVLSDLCNLHCSFCAYRMPNYFTSQLFGEGRLNPDLLMPTPKAMEILDDCADMDVRAIQFTGGGEPTMHPDFLEILEYAHALERKTALVTNGTKMDGDLMEELLKSVWIRVSLDAGDAETYSRMKGREGGFSEVLQNIECLARLRDQRESRLYIGVGFVVTRENWRGIPGAVEAVSKTGANSIRFAAMFGNEGADYFKDFSGNVIKLIDESQKFSTNRFRVIGTFRERFADLSDGRPEFQKCRYMHLATFIGADLNVYACCVTSYNRLGLIGSIKERRFKDFWHGEGKKKFMDDFDARKCPRCQFLGRNRVIQEIMDQLPSGHEDFV